MKKVLLGKTNLLVSQVGMGGIPLMRLPKKEGVDLVRQVVELGVNLIDTAQGYGDSEEKIGEALQGRRKEVILSSKSPAADRKTFWKHLNLSLERLRTDYVDIYHLHGVSFREKMEQVLGPEGAYQGMVEGIKEGKIRHPAFSSHNLEIAKKLMMMEKFEVVQIPFNFIETEAKKEILPLAQKLNLGFIAMKPLGGGYLEDAKLAFRYLSQFKNVVPDPGIENLEQMKEIISILENPGPLTKEEKTSIENLRQELGQEFCHRCDYCQPCPEEIPISMVVRFESFLKRMPLKRVLDTFAERMEKARRCTECKQCVERCPYNLPIPELLKRSIAWWEKLKG